MPDLDPLLDLYRRRGDLHYEGEGVTQLQHGWQCGELALRAGATPELQLAAWLHDLGHLVSVLPGTPTTQGLDDRHESVAAALLRPLFGDVVAEPVALHVQAKRYLVGAQPGYRERLSADSLRSLALQGGPMDAAEQAAFGRRPFAGDAIRLRAWDDAAKTPGWQAPDRAAAIDALAALMRAVASGCPH